MDFLDVLGIILVFVIIGGICALGGRLSEYIELARDKRKKEKAKQHYKEHKEEIDAFINSQSNIHIYRKTNDDKIAFHVKAILKRIDDLVLSSVPDEEPDPDMPIGEYVIKTSPLARLDFLLFMFFDLYCAFGQFRNGDFVKRFNLEFEKALKDYFSKDIDENTIERIFDDRLTNYDAIMRSDVEDKDDALTYQIEQFITRDIWFSDDLFDEKVAIIGFTQKISLKMEIVSLYGESSKAIQPQAFSLAEIATKYRSQGYFSTN